MRLFLIISSLVFVLPSLGCTPFHKTRHYKKISWQVSELERKQKKQRQRLDQQDRQIIKLRLQKKAQKLAMQKLTARLAKAQAGLLTSARLNRQIFHEWIAVGRGYASISYIYAPFSNTKYKKHKAIIKKMKVKYRKCLAMRSWSKKIACARSYALMGSNVRFSYSGERDRDDERVFQRKARKLDRRISNVLCRELSAGRKLKHFWYGYIRSSCLHKTKLKKTKRRR